MESEFSRQLDTEAGDLLIGVDIEYENLFVQVNGEYVGSLFFTKDDNGNLVVEWGTNRNEGNMWEPANPVIVKAVDA
jgi:hypothetical protein